MYRICQEYCKKLPYKIYPYSYIFLHFAQFCFTTEQFNGYMDRYMIDNFYEVFMRKESYDQLRQHIQKQRNLAAAGRFS